MRHRVSGRKFSRNSAHRKAMFQNLACSLLEHEQIRTTLPKAKDLRPIVEKLITLGKKPTLHARRRAISLMRNEKVVTRLMDEVSPRFQDRNGGYTRIIKDGFRHGDNAPMAIIQLVDFTFKEKEKNNLEETSSEEE